VPGRPSDDAPEETPVAPVSVGSGRFLSEKIDLIAPSEREEPHDGSMKFSEIFAAPTTAAISPAQIGSHLAIR